MIGIEKLTEDYDYIARLEVNKLLGIVTLATKNPNFAIEIGDNREIWTAIGMPATKTHLYGKESFRYSTALNMHLPVLFVYSPIIQYQAVGDTYSPLMALAPLHGTYGEYCFINYDIPIFNKLASNYISEIEIRILDHLGNSAPLGHAVTCLTCLFRKRSYCKISTSQ